MPVRDFKHEPTCRSMRSATRRNFAQTRYLMLTKSNLSQIKLARPLVVVATVVVVVGFGALEVNQNNYKKGVTHNYDMSNCNIS